MSNSSNFRHERRGEVGSGQCWGIRIWAWFSWDDLDWKVERVAELISKGIDALGENRWFRNKEMKSKEMKSKAMKTNYEYFEHKVQSR